MSNDTNKAQYMGFNAGDLALYSFPLQPNQDRPAKGGFAAAHGDNLGFKFRFYPNTSNHREGVTIQIPNMAMYAILTKVDELSRNGGQPGEGKWQLMRPNKDKFLPTGDMYKVFRDEKCDGCITIMFKSSSVKYPTMPFRIRPSDLNRLGATEDAEAAQVANDFAMAWQANLKVLVDAHMQVEYARNAEASKQAAANSGFGKRGGGQQGGQRGGYNKPQQQAPSHEVVDFDEDMSF